MASLLSKIIGALLLVGAVYGAGIYTGTQTSVNELQQLFAVTEVIKTVLPDGTVKETTTKTELNQQPTVVKSDYAVAVMWQPKDLADEKYIPEAVQVDYRVWDHLFATGMINWGEQSFWIGAKWEF